MKTLVCLSALLAVAAAFYPAGYAGYAGYAGFATPYAGYAGYATPYAGYAGYATPYIGGDSGYITPYTAGEAGYVTPYAGYATPYAAGYAAPVTYSSQYHSQDELGRASFGHVQADQSHAAVRDAFGNVAGGYSYISPEGEPITVRYTAGAGGFQVESNALPQAPVDTGVAPEAPVYSGQAPTPVDFTPEVKAATAEHLAAVAEAKSRSKRSVITYSGLGYAGLGYAGLGLGYTGLGLGYSSLGLGYSGLGLGYAGLPYAGLPVSAYSAEPGYAAELTETILNPGHAHAYRVDPIA